MAPSAYVSQATILNDKAKEKGISETELASIALEKTTVSEARFQSESSDWRKWFAESSVWGYFCESYCSCLMTK